MSLGGLVSWFCVGEGAARASSLSAFEDQKTRVQPESRGGRGGVKILLVVFGAS